jgi:hypothetical protein
MKLLRSNRTLSSLSRVTQFNNPGVVHLAYFYPTDSGHLHSALRNRHLPPHPIPPRCSLAIRHPSCS